MYLIKRVCLLQRECTLHVAAADAFASICRHEGFGGLYKGFIPGLFGASHGAVQFMAYEELKHLLREYKPDGDQADQHVCIGH